MDDIKVLGDRYELVEPIGRGGMATIFRAKDRRMGRPVAVKILREMYSNDPKFVLRFQREARAVSALAHPNIVQVFDYGQSNEAYYIVMELIEGQDLRKYLKNNGILDIRRAVVIGHDVALALGAAHRRGIVHRDVKPQNILVNDEGLVKLTDFGIATFYRDVNSERLTTTGMTLGTVQYYAPEQAQGEVVQPAADVYALGIVLYEMLVGHPPFDGDTPVSIAVRHIQEAPIRPSRYNPSIPPTLERVILRCLEKDPRDRYRDGDALAYALETFEKPQRTNSGRLSSAPVVAPVAENSGYRRTPSAPMASNVRRPSEPRQPSYEENGNFGRAEEFIMPGPTRPDIAAGTLPGSVMGHLERPDESPPSAVAGITTAVIIASVLLLLAVGCFLTLKLTGLNPFANNSASPTAVTQVKVPDFTKMYYQNDALNLANQSNLKLIEHDVTSTADDKGKVVAQNPLPGQYVAPQSSVTVDVGQGPNTVLVPDVSGMTYDKACAAIQAAKDSQGNPGKLTCQQNVKDSNLTPRGQAIDTNPKAGDQVQPSTVVVIDISTGPAPTATSAVSPTPTVNTTPGLTPTSTVPTVTVPVPTVTVTVPTVTVPVPTATSVVPPTATTVTTGTKTPTGP